MVPSPLVGEGQGEGWPQSTDDECPPDWRTANGCGSGTYRIVDNNQKQRCCTPLPVPPPQGGRERCGIALPISPQRTRVRLRDVCMP